VSALKGGLVAVLVCLVSVAGATCGSSESRAVLTPGYRLAPAARGLAQPMYVTAAPGERDRLYVVLRRGTVRVLERGRLRPELFLDVRDRVQWYGEMGLLSIAFHPDYAANGLMYAAFNDLGAERPVTVVEYPVRNGRAEAASGRVLVRVPHPDSPYHNGGQLQFGPDGRLYVGVGDGGYLRGGEVLVPDPHGNAQNLDVLLGKIFRFDVAAATPTPELVAYGVRNPWRFSFAPNGDLIIGDVGWDRVEEVDVLPSGSGLVNFGWSVYEGRRLRPNAGALNSAGILTGPALTYPTGTRRNCSIIGGYVYRGRAAPSLRGRYVFGDYCSGRIWSVRIANGRASGLRLEPVKVPALNSFGESLTGELYAVSLSGTVYRFARR
jgi:glucose/arabinose dehydrogenase